MPIAAANPSSFVESIVFRAPITDPRKATFPFPKAIE
jgi:hypothetical protein